MAVRILDRFRLNRRSLEHLVDPVSDIGSIPRIIHQTSPESALIPEIRDNVSALRARNPGWEYRFYSDAACDAYVAEHFPRIFPYYRRIHPDYGAARADLFRYLVVYREGGVYLDIKSTFRRPLDQVIRNDDRFLVSHWPNHVGQVFQGWGQHWSLPVVRGEFQQCFIVSSQGHPFLKATLGRVLANINHYVSSLHGVGEDAVLRLTGPVAYTLAILPLLERGHYRMVESDRDLGFVYTVFNEGYSTDHHRMFRTHYSRLDLPVVESGWFGCFADALADLCRFRRTGLGGNG